MLADLARGRLITETAKGPGLFWHKTRNLLLSAERRGWINTRLVDKSMVRLRRLRFRCTDDTEDRDVMVRAHRFAACEASCLALAICEGSALASLDRRLNRDMGETATATGFESSTVIQ